MKPECLVMSVLPEQIEITGTGYPVLYESQVTDLNNLMDEITAASDSHTVYAYWLP